MPIFAVIAPAAEPRLDAAIKRLFPDSFYEIAPGQYLVTDDRATTVDVVDRLKAPEGEVGRVLVTPVQNYGGWHAKDMWEWISTRSAETATPAARVASG